MSPTLVAYAFASACTLSETCITLGATIISGNVSVPRVKGTCSFQLGVEIKRRALHRSRGPFPTPSTGGNWGRFYAARVVSAFMLISSFSSRFDRNPFSLNSLCSLSSFELGGRVSSSS